MFFENLRIPTMLEIFVFTFTLHSSTLLNKKRGENCLDAKDAFLEFQ